MFSVCSKFWYTLYMYTGSVSSLNVMCYVIKYHNHGLWFDATVFCQMYVKCGTSWASITTSSHHRLLLKPFPVSLGDDLSFRTVHFTHPWYMPQWGCGSFHVCLCVSIHLHVHCSGGMVWFYAQSKLISMEVMQSLPFNLTAVYLLDLIT